MFWNQDHHLESFSFFGNLDNQTHPLWIYVGLLQKVLDFVAPKKIGRLVELVFTSQTTSIEELVLQLTQVRWSSKQSLTKSQSRQELLMEEILHQLIGSLSQYLQGFIHPRWCRIPSTNRITTCLLSGKTACLLSSLQVFHIGKQL